MPDVHGTGLPESCSSYRLHRISTCLLTSSAAEWAEQAGRSNYFWGRELPSACNALATHHAAIQSGQQGGPCAQAHGNRTAYTLMIDADFVVEGAWRGRLAAGRLARECRRRWLPLCAKGLKVWLTLGSLSFFSNRVFPADGLGTRAGWKYTYPVHEAGRPAARACVTLSQTHACFEQPALRLKWVSAHHIHARLLHAAACVEEQPHEDPPPARRRRRTSGGMASTFAC